VRRLETRASSREWTSPAKVVDHRKAGCWGGCAPHPCPAFAAVGRYLLARHVFVCLSGEQAILLDLHRDQYLALSDESSRLLGHAVVDWPIVPTGPVSTQQEVDAAVGELAARGLITLDPLRGKPAGTIEYSQPTGTLIPPAQLFADSHGQQASSRASRLARIAIAAVQARLWLRLRSIEWIVNNLSRTEVRPPLDESAARKHVALFYAARPFLFSSRNACLFDSLALLLFLRQLGVYPHWIFAVRTGPFAAHCWLQSGHVVLNDTVDNVRSYTPIMSV